MNPRAVVLLLPLLLAPGAAWSAAGESTVGEITRSNGRAESGRVLVKTPTILRLAASSTVAADAKIAIEHYERVIELSDDPAVRSEALRRCAYLRLQMAEQAADASTEAEARKAADLYERAIADYPDDAHNDRALYQLGRAYQLLGETERASAALQALTKGHPASMLAVESHFRAAELFYLLKHYDAAGLEYQQVLSAGQDSAYRQPSLYKYGWSLYQQGRYQAAITPMLALLTELLPAGTPLEPEAALAQVAPGQADLATDALHVASMSFAALGDDAIARYFAGAGTTTPAFIATLYAAVGSLQEHLHRYTDAAATYSDFTAHYAGDLRSPAFQDRAILALEHGGFGDEVVLAKRRYVDRYAPDGAYWRSRPLPADAAASLRKHLDDLALFYRAQGQHAGPAQRAEDIAALNNAAGMYSRMLKWFPADAHAAEISFAYADTLYDAGDYADAAREYARTAYAYGKSARALEAAYAAVQSYHKLADEGPAQQRTTALRQSIAASMQLTSSFPDHPKQVTVLAQAAADYVELGEQREALNIAERLLDAGRPLAPDVRRDLLGIAANAHFALRHFAQAEQAYTRLAAAPGGNAPDLAVLEQLAASIYRQGEAARAAGDFRRAATQFSRVGQVVPGAAMRPAADYDGAAALMHLEDWRAAAAALEDFRTRYPRHALIADADRKLAWAYQSDHRSIDAGDAYSRITRRESEAPAVRQESAWLAARLYDQGAGNAASVRAYEYYLAHFSGPVDRRMQSQRRLADLARGGSGDVAAYQRWLTEIVASDAAAGTLRNDGSRLMAAQAMLDLARLQAAQARQLSLHDPLAKTLSLRLAATNSAVGSFLRAADYNLVEVTPAASFGVGKVYGEFAQALLSSQRPANLKGDALEQYDLLLEEQSDPFERKAIKAYEANLARIRQGIWDSWVSASADELAALAPAVYGKHEVNEAIYDSMR